MDDKKKSIAYPTITREQRIMLRAKSYISGDLTLDQFVSLERLDEAIEEIEAEEISEKSKAQAEKLKEMYQEEKALTTSKVQKHKKLNLTKEEWDKLRLYEQQELYNAHPDEVKALIESEG